MAGGATAGKKVSLGSFSQSLTTDIAGAPAGIIADITGVAQSIGQSLHMTAPQVTQLERTSIATSAVETGGSFNPQSVGDQGTSFGLFQLHQGGELGSLSAQQAYNPVTNSSVAITQIADVQQQQAGLSPGQVAATAQRPASPGSYATDVNNLLTAPTYGFHVGAGAAAQNIAPNAPTTPNVSVTVPKGLSATNLASGGSSSTATTAGSTTGTTGLLGKIGGYLMGALLIGVGLVIMFRGMSGVSEPVKAVGKAAMA